jgi:hypothetical protein
MALQALGLFLLEASAGTSILLLAFPTRTLGKGFFALHGLLAEAGLALALLVSPDRLRWPLGVISLAALGLYALLAQAGRQRPGLPILALGALGQVLLLYRTCRALDAGLSGWLFAGSLLGGLLFGTVLLTMNLGHWYLISRSLPLSLLFRAALGFAAVTAARAAFLLFVASRPPNPAGWEALTSPAREGLFFLFRVLWGIAGPLALSYFVFRTAKIRSNQAATGLLYVALVFVLIGEILSAYLTVAVRIPA